MAQIAGRVAIVPRGEWSADTTYKKLDLVYYDSASYVARKGSTGIIPTTDSETWMLIVSGLDTEIITEIINGTQPVGDSNKLGGKTAEEWAIAMQNFIPRTTVFNEDGSMVETSSIGTKTTVFNEDGSIVETLVTENETYTKTTTFSDNEINEEVS